MAIRSGRRPGPAQVDLVAGAGLLGTGVAVTGMVLWPRGRALVQRLDDQWYEYVQRHRSAPLAGVSRVLDVALGTTVDWTVRVAVTGLLVRQRRWRALSGWAATIALGEVCIGPLKAQVDRTRPAEPHTVTSMTSYPSGHAIAAATTCPGIVLALLPPGPQRAGWLGTATAVAAATALSRTYLNAHWLSDSVGGFCLGAGFSLLVPPAVDAVADRATARRRPSAAAS